MSSIGIFVGRCLRRLGYDLRRLDAVPPDFGPEETEMFQRVQPFTQTQPEAIVTLVEAIRYLVRHKIEGAIVECGVWRGGSMRAAAETLLALNEASRDLYLFDTFEGMTEPNDIDVDVDIDIGMQREAPTAKWKRLQRKDGGNDWNYVPLEQVQKVIYETGYDQTKIHFVKGRVEDTLPKHSPQKIALLRLDTDWYQSTHHELVHLFPNLVPGGILIIDDYGSFKGSKKAVDEYFELHNIATPLIRIDRMVRLAIKPLSSAETAG